MTEIIDILIQILFILFIISFPITLLETDNKSKISTFSLIDKLSINLIFLINREYYYKTPLHHRQKNHPTEFFYQ